jgi:hypothetical protein
VGRSPDIIDRVMDFFRRRSFHSRHQEPDPRDDLNGLDMGRKVKPDSIDVSNELIYRDHRRLFLRVLSVSIYRWQRYQLRTWFRPI